MRAIIGDEVARALNGGGEGKPLLGDGHLAMTIDPGAGMERYQGIVALAGNTLVDAAHEYFDQSEQIPTFIRIAVARHYTAGDGARPGQWGWRAGGLMVQKLTREGGRQDSDDVSPADGDGADDDGWRRALALAATVEDHELLDPTLLPERLLYRLFHEEEVRAFDPAALDAQCNCSRERVETMLNQFSAEELDGMAEDDVITVTCEFCNTHYKFDAEPFTGNDQSRQPLTLTLSLGRGKASSTAATGLPLQSASARECGRFRVASTPRRACLERAGVRGCEP